MSKALSDAIKSKIVMDAATDVLAKIPEETLRPLFVQGVVDAIKSVTSSWAVREQMEKLIVDKAIEILQEPAMQRQIAEKARDIAQIYVNNVFGPAAKRLEWALKENAMKEVKKKS
jgi:lactate dehydrogenase-like 2-hydroxyacid dehydrogenase